MTPRIDPAVLGDLAALEASHRRKIKAVEEAENPVRAHAARIDLSLFEALYCEQEKVEATR